MSFTLLPSGLGELRIQAEKMAGNSVVYGMDEKGNKILMGGGRVALQCYLHNKATRALYVGAVNFDGERLPTIAEVALAITH